LTSQEGGQEFSELKTGRERDKGILVTGSPSREERKRERGGSLVLVPGWEVARCRQQTRIVFPRKAMSSSGNWNMAVALSMALASLPTSVHCASSGAETSVRAKLSSLPPTSAEMGVVLFYPFEVVFHAWENGPQDKNFIREEKKEVWSGSEMSVEKVIYTRNPFPYLIKKTVRHQHSSTLVTNSAFDIAQKRDRYAQVIREEQLIWYEEQKINKKQRYASYYSCNKNLNTLGTAYRKATMRADPNNPGTRSPS
jgi:hypothetical protein